MKKLIYLFAMVVLVSGCATTNPFQSKFQTLEQAYQEKKITPYEYLQLRQELLNSEAQWQKKQQGQPNFWSKLGNALMMGGAGLQSAGNAMQGTSTNTSAHNYQYYNQQQAPSGCVWQWDCTTSPCQQVPLCSSTIDIVPPRPPSIAPIPMPTIKPVTIPSVPPVGTTQCNQRYICNGNDCEWKNVCQ